MKKILPALFVMIFCTAAFAQSDLPAIDKSPLDICYYPVNYPLLKVQDKTSDPAIARVIYSRPKIEGRSVFGSLVEFGKLWRLGANEATEIEFYRPVTIAGKKIAKGRYTLYAITSDKNWTFILSKDTDTWGSFKYDQSKDVVRVDAPVETLPMPVESLAMTFEKAAVGNTINLVVVWENTKAALPFTP